MTVPFRIPFYIQTNKKIFWSLAWDPLDQHLKARCWLERNQCLKLMQPSVLASLIIFLHWPSRFLQWESINQTEQWKCSPIFLTLGCMLCICNVRFWVFWQGPANGAKRPVSFFISNPWQTDAFRKYSEDEFMENGQLLGCSFSYILRFLTAFSEPCISWGHGKLPVRGWGCV